MHAKNERKEVRRKEEKPENCRERSNGKGRHYKEKEERKKEKRNQICRTVRNKKRRKVRKIVRKGNIGKGRSN